MDQILGRRSERIAETLCPMVQIPSDDGSMRVGRYEFGLERVEGSSVPRSVVHQKDLTGPIDSPDFDIMVKARPIVVALDCQELAITAPSRDKRFQVRAR